MSAGNGTGNARDSVAGGWEKGKARGKVMRNMKDERRGGRGGGGKGEGARERVNLIEKRN